MGERETKEKGQRCLVFKLRDATQTGGDEYEVTVTSESHNHKIRKDKQTDKAPSTQAERTNKKIRLHPLEAKTKTTESC